MRTPAEDAERLASEMQALARRLQEAEGEDAPMFTKEAVARIVADRLSREYKKRRRTEAERDALEVELAALRQASEDTA